MSLSQAVETSALRRQRSGALALAVLKFGLAGCGLALVGTLGAVFVKMFVG